LSKHHIQSWILLIDNFMQKLARKIKIELKIITFSPDHCYFSSPVLPEADDGAYPSKCICYH
jgi:hypothetical protein